MADKPHHVAAQQLTLLPAEADRSKDEFFETLIKTTDGRLERIISQGHRSPDGFWYDQSQWEWVTVLQGAARLEFADPPGKIVSLEAGDAITIPAHCRHRVEWTSSEPATIWLALHYDPPSAGG